MKLRPYEERAVADLLKLLPEKKRVLAVGPTGCGKTVIGAAIVQSLPRGARIGWLAHRVELLRQARAEIVASGVPESDVGILSGTEKANVDARVMVASVDMFRSRPVREALPHIDLWIVDEAHHVAAQSYGDVLDVHPDAPLLGLTATPWRLDGQPLGDSFDHLYVIAEALELIADGFLLKSVVYGIPREKARELVRDAGAGKEYSAQKLEVALKKRPLMADIVKEWFRLAEGRRTIVYACTRDHGREIAKRFRKASVAVAYVDGETSAKEREALLGKRGALTSGRVRVVVNVGVITEGFDCPPVECIIVARPTKSLTLWRQMCGRGARPLKGKRFLVLDHAGNVWRHRFPEEPIEWSLEGRAAYGSGDAPVKRCPECGFIMASGHRECPECGAAQPVTERELQEQKAEMERLRASEADRTRREEVIRKLASIRGVGEDWVRRALAEAG